MDAKTWIETVIEQAAALRKAGVTTIAIEGCSVTLQPVIADDHGPDVPTVSEPDNDPLNSPATYADGKVPGFDRPKAS